VLVKQYGELRQAALGDLVDIMSKASPSNMGTQSKWQSRISQARGEYKDLFGKAAGNLMLPPAHQLFWSSALDAEEKFFDVLSKAPTPQRMDDLLQHQDNLSKLLGALQDTWTFLLSQNENLKTDEMRTIEDLDKMAQEILAQLDDYWSKTLDDARKVTMRLEERLII
jgi:hypothetical protein